MARVATAEAPSVSAVAQGSPAEAPDAQPKRTAVPEAVTIIMPWPTDS